MKTSTLTTRDNKVADEWMRKFDAREPLEVSGQLYLIDGLSSRGYDVTITLHPVVKVAVEPTVKALDLSNPPSGATHYHRLDTVHPFRKKVNGVCFAWHNDQWRVIGDSAQRFWEPLPAGYMLTPIADLIEHGYLASRVLHRQLPGLFQRQTFSAQDPQHQQIPKAAQWDGEGLPPVGVDFEVLWSSTCKTYVTAKAVGHEEDGRVVYRITSGERAGEYQAERQHTYERDTLPNFRPIKTAEQLAAEQREAEINRFAKDITAGRSPLGSFEHSKVVATWLYDNDYRKVPK